MKTIELDKVKIRLANDNDLCAIVNLLADDELGKTREVNVESQEVPECYAIVYDRIKNDPNHMLAVMDYNDEIIGTLQLIIIPTLTHQGCIRAEVEGVRIKSNYRNFGLGKLFFSWVKKTAIANGCGLIQLTTNKDRKAAKIFYESIGFIESHCGMKLWLK